MYEGLLPEVAIHVVAQAWELVVRAEEGQVAGQDNAGGLGQVV